MSILPVCPVFIVIKGPEGGATAEFGRTFAHAFGRSMLNCPWDLRPTQREAMERFCEGSPLAQRLFRACAIAAISDVIRGDLANDWPVVIDRYWLSATRSGTSIAAPSSSTANLHSSRAKPSPRTTSPTLCATNLIGYVASGCSSRGSSWPGTPVGSWARTVISAARSA